MNNPGDPINRLKGLKAKDASDKKLIASAKKKCSGPNPPAKCAELMARLKGADNSIEKRVRAVQEKVVWQDQLKKLPPNERAAALMAAGGAGVPANNPLAGWDDLPQWKWLVVAGLAAAAFMKMKKKR